MFTIFESSLLPEFGGCDIMGKFRTGNTPGGSPCSAAMLGNWGNAGGLDCIKRNNLVYNGIQKKLPK